jgi:hypothetical protein
VIRNIHFHIGAGQSGIDGSDDALNMGSESGPLGVADYNNRDLPLLEVLLILKVLIAGHEHFESVLLGRVEQVAIPETVPPQVRGDAYHVGGQILPDRKRVP